MKGNCKFKKKNNFNWEQNKKRKEQSKQCRNKWKSTIKSRKK